MNNNIIPIQLRLRQELPKILGSIDYEVFSKQLIRIDEILNDSTIEQAALSHWFKDIKKKIKKLSERAILNARRAFRL